MKHSVLYFEMVAAAALALRFGEQCLVKSAWYLGSMCAVSIELDDEPRPMYSV